MSRIRRRRDRDRRVRVLWAVAKLSLLLAALAAVGAYGHRVGGAAWAGRLAEAEAELARLSADASALRAEDAGLRQALAAAEARAADYRQRYQEAAAEPLRPVLAEARAKLAEGLSPERLAFLVSQAREPRDCTAAETRRFLVRTANYDGANTWVRFDDLITVTALGAAAESGRAGWFDPEAEVTVSFTPLGGRALEVRGRLPLQHAFVFKDKEYRFAAVPGRRGFVEVTGDWCPAPAGGHG